MDKKEKLEELKKKMSKDETLPLKKYATSLVFGDGNPDTEILFIGEGPGFWEDKKGVPFVGNAGALLNQLLHSIELPREKVFITNVVHHRPPENRDPEPSEISAYAKYLDEIIDIIGSNVIVTLGRFSMGKFLPGAKISSIHGKKHVVHWKDKEIIVVPMFHPAAALRSTDVKSKLFEDFKNLPNFMEDLKKQEKAINVEQMELI